MRANCENSSTSAFSESTSPTIVDVHSSTSACVGVRRAVEMAPHALGAQLNRRQRILDLVREPPRHFAPGRHLLRANQRRHVVEHQHHAVRSFGAAKRRRHGGQLELALVARQRNLLRRRLRFCPSAAARSSAPNGCRSSRPNTSAAGWPTADGVQPEQPHRCPVERADVSRGVDRHDAGGDALEDRLDIPPAAFDFDVLALEVDRSNARAAAGSSPLRSPCC